MATMNIVVDMPANPLFNTDTFKHKVQDYASMLVTLMTKQSSVAEDNVRSVDKTDALSFIQSLAVKGGEKVPANIDAMDCLISEKYER